MNIIAFAGKKGAGKSTMCNFLHGYFLKAYELIDAFDITESGDLVIETDVIGEDNHLSKGKGLIDIKRLDIDFALWASATMWPTVKHYAFATPFKEMAVELFGLDREDVYGPNERKNKLTKYKWEDMPFKSKKTGFMTVREFIQALGTEVFRKIKDDIWVERAMRDIEAEQPMYATISDMRHPQELEAVRARGGKTIFLTGGEEGDDHSSENQFDKMAFDLVLDTSKPLDQTCHELVDALMKWEIIPKQVVSKNSPSKPKAKSVGKIK